MRNSLRLIEADVILEQIAAEITEMQKKKKKKKKKKTVVTGCRTLKTRRKRNILY
jgi:hypothetical protein